MPATHNATRRDTYNVSGSLADVVAAIEGRGGEAGRASWHPTYSWQPDGETIGSVQFVSDYVIEMPVWTDYTSAPPEDQAEWDRFIAALEVHEQGHVQIAQFTLDTADPWFVGQPSSEADRLWQELLAELQRQSDSYDAETNHGINTGCTITYTAP